MSSSAACPDRLRVLSVMHPFRPAFGGESEWWLRMVPRLRERGVDIEILTTVPGTGSNGHGNGHPETVEGVVVHRVRPDVRFPEYPARIAALLRQLRSERQRLDLALFHAPNYDAVYASCLAGRALGWKTVYKATLQRSDDLETIQRTGRMGHVRSRLLQLADGVIAMSPVMVGTFAERLRDRLLIVPQGVDTSRFRPRSFQERTALREPLGLGCHQRVALFCGAIIERKGVDILVDAWQQVHRELPNATLLMVGPTHRDGLDEPEFRAFSQAIEGRIHALGLSGTVRLLGLQRRIENLYGASDLFILPSRNEGWANVISEAMASGLPCILSSMDRIAHDHLQHGREGIVVDSEAPAEYARALIDLLSDDARRTTMGERGRTRILTRVDVDLVADNYAAFFRQIAHSRAA